MWPPLLCECMESRMTSHDWFLLSFFWNLLHKKTNIDPHHFINPWRVCVWYTFGRVAQIQATTVAFYISFSVKFLPFAWSLREVNYMAADCAKCQSGCSVSSIIYSPFSIFWLASICSNIDLSIKDGPPLVRTLVTYGGVQLTAQRDNPSVG